MSAATPDVADKCAGWLQETGGDVRSLAWMLEQASRSVSHSAATVQLQTFPWHTPNGGSAKRYDNWLAECNVLVSAAWRTTC